MSWLVDPAQRVMTTALDGYARREQAIAANLANIDTPGYRSASVDFESEMAAAMAGGTGPVAMNPPTEGPSAALGLRRAGSDQLAGSLGTGSIGVQAQAPGLQTRIDGNGVDLETEMTALAETQLKYSAVSRMLTGKLGMLRDVVSSR
jgi:flagellar basal-body rod protein FlgB